MPIYRNQTNTMSQIQALSRIRITNAQEATALLRALMPLYEQVAHILQVTSVARTLTRNAIKRDKEAQATTQPAPIPTVPEPTAPFTPEPIDTEEGYSQSDVEAKLETLKKATKTTKAKSTKKGTK